jgi:type I restriction enzyme S subunit
MIQDFSNVKLRGVLEERSGITWSAEQESQTPVPGAMPVLTVTNVQETLQTEPMLYIRGVSERDRERKAAKRGWTIAVGSNGNRGRIGNCVFIERDTEYLFASFLVAFRPKPNSEIDPEYFYRWMSSYEIQARLSASSEGTTGLGNLSTRYFRNLWISYPTNSGEQARIVELLRLVDTSIAAARESIAKAGRLQKGLMQQLFTGHLKADGTPRPQDEFNGHPKLGLVPRDWLCAKGRQVFRLHSGYAPEALAFTAPNNDGDCLFMKVDDFNHPINRIAIKTTAQSLNLGDGMKDFDPCQANWLVIAKRGAAITHNRVRLLSGPTLLDPNLMGIEMLNGHLPGFFRYLLTQLNLSRFLEVSSVPQLNNKDLYPRWFALPQRDEQKEILRVLENVEQLFEAKRTKITALQRLKKSLMQNLLTGHVRLPVEGTAMKETPR